MEAHIKYFRCMKNSTGNLDMSREYISKIKPALRDSYGTSKELKILKQKTHLSDNHTENLISLEMTHKYMHY